MRARVRTAAPRVEEERDRPQRQEVEEVPLLHVTDVAVQHALKQERRRQRDGDRAERRLCAVAWARDGERRADRRAGDDDETAREREDDQLGREIFGRARRIHSREKRGARVVAGVPQRPRDEQRGARHDRADE